MVVQETSPRRRAVLERRRASSFAARQQSHRSNEGVDGSSSIGAAEHMTAANTPQHLSISTSKSTGASEVSSTGDTLIGNWERRVVERQSLVAARASAFGTTTTAIRHKSVTSKSIRTVHSSTLNVQIENQSEDEDPGPSVPYPHPACPDLTEEAHKEASPSQQTRRERLARLNSQGSPTIRAAKEKGKEHPSPNNREKESIGFKDESDATVLTGNTKYYRIVYRGVVALLSQPERKSVKSGAYVSYGEIIVSQSEIQFESMSPNDFVDGSDSPGEGPVYEKPSALSRASPRSSSHSNSVSSLESSIRTVSTIAAAPPLVPCLVEPNPSKTSKSTSYLTTAIRVDEVLTGGYAVDAQGDDGNKAVETSKTPKRSNMQLSTLPSSLVVVSHTPKQSEHNDLEFSPSVSSTTLSALSVPNTVETAMAANGYTTFVIPSPQNDDDMDEKNEAEGIIKEPPHYGYLILKRKDVMIAEQIPIPPLFERGHFLFRACSSTPVPILAGPATDAPRTKAMALPGSIHEVCLKMTLQGHDTDGVIFLRLRHRRGWVPDRRFGPNRSQAGGRVTFLMKELTNDLDRQTGDDISLSGLSMTATSSIATPAVLDRRRLRPIRRKRNPKDEETNTSNIARGSVVSVQNRNKSALPGTPNRRVIAADNVLSPTSNVSILSEDSTLVNSSFSQPIRALNNGASNKFLHGVLEENDRLMNSLDSSNGQDHDDMLNSSAPQHNPHLDIRPPPSFFLMRVTAPKGLKILDAPHFQVNKLIHGQTGLSKTALQALNYHGSKLSKAPSSIFHTMAGSVTTESSCTAANVTDTSARSRILPRGTVFESSRRAENGGVYTPGSGLIKLSDGSGWAIIPKKEDLDSQYRGFRGGLAGVREGEASRAYEEVGNAILSVSDAQTQLPTQSTQPVWLRIRAKNGITVVCAPPAPPTEVQDEGKKVSPSSPTSSMTGSSVIGMKSSNESDVGSVASSLFDSMFRTPRKYDANRRAAQEATIETNDSGMESQVSTGCVIPCGMCVQVEDWEEPVGSSTDIPSQDFVRLCGGQGWIPREINREVYAVEVEAPDMRIGSFWFRVQSQPGIKVRQGPSRKAGSIRSDAGNYFRFECGEFLRASQILTVFSRRNVPGNSPGDEGRVIQSSECFARLYRRSNQAIVGASDQRQQQIPILTTLTIPGEWVQVHGNGRLYLEECVDPPSMERHARGWRYNALYDIGVPVRVGPSFAADLTDKVLLAGESVLINERVKAPGDSVSWLRLKDGQGWVHDQDHDGNTVMVAHSLRHRKTVAKQQQQQQLTSPLLEERLATHNENDATPYNGLIARLFHDNDPHNADNGMKFTV